MEITVPYIYTAMVVKPKCRNEVAVAVQDKITVDIKEFFNEDLPLAIKNEDQKIHLLGKQLWTLSLDSVSGVKPYSVSIATAKENTENGGKNYKWSSNSTSAPFLRFFRYLDSYSVEEEGYNAKTKNQIESGIRKWESDNRLEVRKAIIKKARQFIVHNGYMMEKTTEPFYVVMCFGLGGNHGGTGLLTSTRKSSAACFNALDFAKAKEYAIETAERRGDTESVPHIKAKNSEIKVIMPEAIKFVTGTNY